MEKKKYKIKLLWMNAWFGLIFLIMFIPSVLFFVNHSLLIQIWDSKVVATQVEVTISDDGSHMQISTEKGLFNFYERNFFDKIIEKLNNAEYIEIWHFPENRNLISKISINHSDFITPRGRIGIVLFLFLLILSSFALTVSIMLIIQTKGWGDEDLLEKYPKGLLRTIFEQDK